jgi:catechol 2,3-dioxygenase-like lactoylglutathione lyase family enzyme
MKFLHVAVQMKKIENAVFFFEEIFHLERERTYILKENLAEEIFGIKENYNVILYKLNGGFIEVFIGKKNPCISLNHIALSIPNREEVINTAKKFGLWVYEKERRNKNKLVFIKDPDGNLYELKKQEN